VEGLCIDGSITLPQILKKWTRGCGLDLCGPVLKPCGQGKIFRFHEMRSFLENLYNSQLLKKAMCCMYLITKVSF
jgi:hypothetical protein